MGCEYYYVVTESPPHSLPGGAVPGNCLGRATAATSRALGLRLAWDGVLGPELGEVSAEGCRQLAALETLGELLAGGDLALVTAGRSHQPRQDAALGHLQPLGHRRDSSQAGGQSRYIG